MQQCSRCLREMPPSETVCASCGPEPADPVAPVVLPDEFDEQELALDSDLLELPEDAQDPDVSEVPATIASAPAVSSWNRRELVAIPIAVVGGAILMFGLLMARGVASPEAAAAPSETAARSSAEPARPATATGAKWSTANVARWIGNGRRSFAAELVAENNVAIWQREVKPVLVVRCLSRRPEVFVFTDSAAKIEPRTEDHTVRLVFDGGEEATERWPDSADHDALFAPDGSGLAQRLTAARTMQFGFTPHNASPVVAHFNVMGLGELLRASGKDCGWRR
jgi:hypothetical protein